WGCLRCAQVELTFCLAKSRKGRGIMGNNGDLTSYVRGKVVVVLLAVTAVSAAGVQVLAPSVASAVRPDCISDPEQQCEGGTPTGGGTGTPDSGGTGGSGTTTAGGTEGGGAANPGGTTVNVPTTTGSSSTDAQPLTDEQAQIEAAIAAYDRAHSGSPSA